MNSLKNTPALQVDRHEEKFLLNPGEAALLRGLLDGVLHRDRFSAAGAYYIRSLYFDTPFDNDYADKVLGISERRKVRLRIYRHDTPTVRLELKEKQGIYSHKTGVSLTRAEAEALIAGDRDLLRARPDAAARRAGNLLVQEARRPVVLVDYERTAWTMPVERVRITLDERVRAARSSALFDAAVPMVGVHSGDAVILEVKYDHYLPGHIRRLLSAVRGQGMSISKYAAAREFLY